MSSTDDATEREDAATDRERTVAPTQTRDDTDEGWGDWRDREDRDAWLKEQRPPHWD